MKASRVIKLIGTLGVISACLLLVVGCTPENNDESSGLVAATVNGAEISEDNVTRYIENLRKAQGLETDEAWGEWLASAKYTPSSVRETVIDTYVERELIRQAAAEHNIVVESDEIDGYVNNVKSNYSSEEAWQQALEQARTTEQEYREILEIAVMQEQLQNIVIEPSEPTNEELLEAVKAAVPGYDGAKRTSHILFDIDDAATAQEVLAKVKSGELDFAEAAKEYSSDTSSTIGGDIGWDKLTDLVSSYTDAVNSLDLNEISDLVESEFGLHIIKVTEVFNAPEEITDVSQIPDAFVEAVRETLTTDDEEAFRAWLAEYKEGADIVINEIPADVSYNIDMTPFEQEDAEGEDPVAIDNLDPSETPEATMDATDPEADVPADATEATDPEVDVPADDGTPAAAPASGE